MDFVSTLVILAIALAAAIFIARPLVEGGGWRVTEEERHLSTLQAERERVLAILQELDMDHAMGKILPEDYRIQREALVSHGAEVLRSIDGLQGTLDVSSEETALEAELEAAVARLRRAQTGVGAGFCGTCGEPVLEDDRFCTHCGASLTGKVET